VVPKHRRSEIEPSLASAGVSRAADFWPEAVGYGQAPAAYPDVPLWEEWANIEDWGPPPELHPDHPSAPVPRIQLPADHPSRPMPAIRGSDPLELAHRRPGDSGRTPTAPPRSPGAGYGNGNRRLHLVPRDLPVARPPAAPRVPGDLGDQFPRPSAARLAAQGRQAAADYRREAGPSGPGPGPVTGRVPQGRPPRTDSLWAAGQVLTLADDRAAQITQEAQHYAAAIRAAAERDAAAMTQQAASRADEITHQATGQAAAIRDAAEREAAELRARLESMSGELGRVAAYVTDNLVAAPGILAAPVIAPALPGAAPALPAAPPASPTPPARPALRPARPDAKPGPRPARPAGPATTPARDPQKRPRQLQAMRVATYATATLLAFAVATGATEIGLHGFKFFTFREAGVGQTSGNQTDQNFLAPKPKATHHAAAPKGRHHKKAKQTLEVHH
jgi:hypothetical protein